MPKKIVVRRGGTYVSSDIHERLFPRAPKRRSLADLKVGIASHVKQRRSPGNRADALSSLIETVHLLRSPANARRLLSALRRALGRKGR